ncbi:MAG: M6 family metalloprotease domain-containing protein, partial [Muribaculaceae bacterium]|nr:M6 family metalloprotease domain-containing protein [Muribaculaceae bacterium]
MRYLLLAYLLTLSLAAHAIIAHPSPATITQPDGSTVEIKLHGDEYLSFTTTIDGFTLILDNDGFMKYAVLANDSLLSSDIVAHDASLRSKTEKQWLSKTPHYLVPKHSAAEAMSKRRNVSMAPALSLSQQASQAYNYDKFKGLVILVEFNDCKFSRDDINQIFTDMITKENYDGFVSSAGNKIQYTGSVRDYFYSNSMGRFNPNFDIVGPVTIDYAQTYPCASENNHIIIPAALKAADPLVDYSLYDTDGDNAVDMVYFIFAGAGSNYAGNNSHYLWPHAAQVGSSMSLDGVKFKRYACSTEFYGQEKDRIIDGIGTICHEFSHVLGLPDLYDTDYATNGLSTSPEDWSIMAGGSYLNYARTPCCYSLYERYALGFASPEKITSAGEYSMQTIGQSNTGYRIDSSIQNEYFLLENRQNVGWDAHLPGHGMIVFRVDSTSVDKLSLIHNLRCRPIE